MPYRFDEKYRYNEYCIDCNKKIGLGGMRCRSCGGKRNKTNYTLKSCGNYHNYCGICRPDVSRIKSEDTRKKLSKALTGLKKSEEHINNIRVARQNTIYTVKSCGFAHAWCKICEPEHATKVAEAVRNRTKEEWVEQASWRVGLSRLEKTKKKISIALAGQELSQETRKKISIAVNKAIDEERFFPENNFSAKKVFYNGTWFRKNWEVFFVKWLDSQDIKWVYEPKRFRLKNGSSYLPDFYLPDKDIWVEVKGRKLPESIAKVKAFKKEYNVKIILADGDWFKKKGIPLR